MNFAAVMHLPLGVLVPAAVLSVIALALGAAWLARAAAGYVTARNGQNWETVLLLGFFAAAASMSADGLLGFAQHSMRLNLPMAVVFWLALDGAAGMLLSMVRRRARANRSTWHVRAVVWGIIAASAGFNWMHAPDMPGAPLAFAAMPVIAGVLAEMAVADIREERRAADGPAPVRRVELARWLHPAESVRVMSAMAADPSVSAAGATRHVRAEAAARALYRLRLAMESGDENARRAAETRAQAAFDRAGFAATETPEDILRRVQVKVQLRDFAALDYGTAEAAKEAVNSLIPGGQGGGGNNVPPDPDRDEQGNPSPRGTSGTKESAARKWWDGQIAAGLDPWSIEAKDINEAAGATEKSSFGRQFKSRRIKEMSDAPESGEGEAAV